MTKWHILRYSLVWLLWLTVSCQQSHEPRIPHIIAEVPFDLIHPREVAGNVQTGQVFILNEGYSVSMFEGTEQVATLQTDQRNTRTLVIDEVRGWVYVVNDKSDTVTVVRDMAVEAVLEVAGDEPRDIALNPANGWAYVVTGYKRKTSPDEERIVEGNVTVIRGTEVIGTIPLGRVLATLVAVDPVHHYIYVSGAGGAIVVLKALEEVARFDIGATATAIDVNPQTGDVYVLNRTVEGEITHFREGQLIGKADVERDGGSVNNLRVHPITGDVYVVDFIAKEVVVVRLIEGELRVIGRSPVGSGPEKMTIDPVTGNVYVANFYEDTVSVIYGTETIATIDVGYYPYGIGVNPANGWVYVSNTNGNSVTILGFAE